MLFTIWGRFCSFLDWEGPRKNPGINMYAIIHLNDRPPDKSAYCNFFSLFLIQNICCGYSKEQSQRDGSFEHPKHIFKLMGKKIIKILCK